MPNFNEGTTTHINTNDMTRDQINEAINIAIQIANFKSGFDLLD